MSGSHTPTSQDESTVAPTPGTVVAPTAPRKERAEALDLRAKPAPVTRLNRTTIMLLITALVIAIMAFTFWGLRRSAPKSTESADSSHNVDHVARAEGLSSLPDDYAGMAKPRVDVPRLGPPIGELGRPVLRKEQEAGIAELPERTSDQPSPEEDALRAQRLRQQQQTEAAAAAAVFVQLKQRTRQSESTPTATTASAAAESSPGELQGLPRPSTTSNTQERKESFLKGQSTDTVSSANVDSRIYASGTLQTPRSSAQLMAGTIIPAALMTAIDSDLPGEIEAQVTSPVYDSLSGRVLLIPQGARLFGQYDSQISFGQRRVLLVWTRLIMPDGSSVVLDRLPGMDVAGQAGLEDGVDWHTSRLAAGAALSTVLSVATELAAPNQVASSGGGVVVLGVRQGAQDTLSQVAQEITRRNLDVQPTLHIRQGFPLRILLNKDLLLRPYGVNPWVDRWSTTLSGSRRRL